MKKRSIFTFLVAVIFMLAASMGAPFTGERVGLRPVEAQAQIGFGGTRAPAIDFDKGGRLYVMMSTATNPPSAGTPGSEIFFTKSPDDGATWDNFPVTRRLTRARGEAFGPSLAVNRQGKTRVYTVFHDNSSGVTQVFLIRSKKKTKFKAAENITPHEGGAFTPRIALDSTEALNVVWGDLETNRRRVVFVRSTDLGETFGDPVDVSRSEGDAFEPEIAVDSADAINVAWEDSEPGVNSIMFARSTDGGATFSEPLRISQGSQRASEPHVAVNSSGNIYIAWISEGEGNAQVLFARSTDGGATFSEPVDLSNDPGARNEKPYVAAFQDKVYVAYNDRGQVYLVTSDNSGESFSSREQVSQADRRRGRAHSAAMVVDTKGKLHLVWIDSSFFGEPEGLLFYRNTTDGRRFQPQVAIFAVVQLGGN